MSAQTKKTMKYDSIHVIVIIIFYDNRKLLIFKLLGIVVYWFLEKCFCIEYFCLQKENRPSVSHRLFEDTSFDEILRIGTPDILVNVLACYGFGQEHTSTLIWKCMSKFVSYSLSKIFVMLAQYSQALQKPPVRVKIHPYSW